MVDEIILEKNVPPVAGPGQHDRQWTGLFPGMMTGQILGGEDPLLSVKYQIAMVIAILVCMAVTVALSIMFTLWMSFDGYGVLRKNIFS